MQVEGNGVRLPARLLESSQANRGYRVSLMALRTGLDFTQQSRDFLLKRWKAEVRPRLARSNPGKTNCPVRQFHKCIFYVRELIGSGLGWLNASGSWPSSRNILPLQHNVRKE
jgi:hypothetical protein